MAYELREGQGSLFKNDKKTADNHPDYTGTVLIHGEKMRLAGWKKQGKNGGTFLSISISEFQNKAPQQSVEQVEDDMPF